MQARFFPRRIFFGGLLAALSLNFCHAAPAAADAHDYPFQPDVYKRQEPYFVAPGCYFGPFTPMYSETYVPAKFLRLTFDTNNVLQATKEFVR